MSNPTLAVFPLVDDFDGTGPSGALALTPTGPERFDAGLWLEAANSNYVFGPVGINNTNWFAGTNTAVAFNQAVPGPLPGWLAGLVTTCVKVTASAAIAPGISVLTSMGLQPLGSAVPHAGQVYVWLPSDWDATAMEIYFSSFTSGVITPAAVNMSLRDQWQAVTGAIIAPDAGDLAGAMTLRKAAASSGVTSGRFFYASVACLSPGAVVESPISGGFGTGYAWVGTANNSRSTRAASSASVATTGLIAPTSGSLAFRSTRKIDTGAEEIILTVGTVGAATDAMRIGYDATDHPFMEFNSDNAGWQRVTATATVAANVEALLYFDWTGTTIRCSVDNGALDSDTRDAVEDDWGAGALALVA